MKLKKITLLSMFTSLMIVMTYIKIPVYPIVFTLQTFIVILISLLFKPLDTFLIILSYLTLGFIGIPVFASGGGPQAFLSPTGGFLVGLLIAGVCISIFKSKNNNIIRDIISILVFGFIFLYVIGISIFMVYTNLSLNQTLIAFIPYYLWDLVKIIGAYVIYKLLPKELIAKIEVD